MGIDPTKIRHSNTSFKGVTPGPYAKCTGSVLLKVVFGSPDKFRREKLIFHIAPFKSGHQALLGREAFARFNAIPHLRVSYTQNARSTRHHPIKGKLRVFLDHGKRETALTAAH